MGPVRKSLCQGGALLGGALNLNRGIGVSFEAHALFELAENCVYAVVDHNILESTVKELSPVNGVRRIVLPHQQEPDLDFHPRDDHLRDEGTVPSQEPFSCLDRHW